MKYGAHYSVLWREVLDILSPKDDKEIYIADLTFGGGGHTLRLAENPLIKMISFDQDQDALENGRRLIAERSMQDKVTLIDSNFENFQSIISEQYPQVLEHGFSGILMDLGVSSHHFDSPGRGFSFLHDAELDMRMNQQDLSIKKASDIVNHSSQRDLEYILDVYGEEKFYKRIAERIVQEREKKPITRTRELENLVFHCYPKELRKGRINPATKTFQALRIVVNRELEVLENTLRGITKFIKDDGKVAVISFHSLEDRIVKNIFREICQEDESYDVLTKKPIIPSNEEILENSRSRSAKMRVLVKRARKKKNKYEHLKNKSE